MMGIYLPRSAPILLLWDLAGMRRKEADHIMIPYGLIYREPLILIAVKDS